jgi:2-dehydro-3-deoxygluconokinase
MNDCHGLPRGALPEQDIVSATQHWFIGECMAELRRAGPGLLAQSFAGDVYNTAVYFERSFDRSIRTRSSCFVSAVGTDVLSAALLAEASAQGLDLRHVASVPDRQPGLYWIEVDSHGERSFLYWRTQSAARRMLDDAHYASLRAQARACSLLYFSGITLAILDDGRRNRLLELAHHVEGAGGWIVFDSNYRPGLWESPQHAVRWCNAVLHLCTHALVTFEDEQRLHGDADPDESLKRLLGSGVQDVVVKLGADGCAVQTSTMAAPARIPALIVEPIDTTAAGDSFNAAYLAARIAGGTAEAAARAGNKLAALVVSHRGAIIDKNIDWQGKR